MKTTNPIDGVTQSLNSEAVLRVLLLGILTLIIVATVILSWVPPVSRDALTHHLAVPKLYLHYGMVEIPSILFSYYPMNLDLLYMIPLYFGNDIAPKWIHFLFALLTAGLIYGYLIKRLGAVWAIFGVIFFLSLPIIVKLSITVYVDLGLIFFSTAVVLSLLKWVESGFQIRFLSLAAVCCGLALGTKYNGLIVFLILTLFIPFVYLRKFKTKSNLKDAALNASIRKIQLKALGFAAVFVLIALLVFSPWMIRNFVWTANPIYPLYEQVFDRLQKVPAEGSAGLQIPETDSDIQPPSRTKSASWGSFAIRRVIYGESWWEIALIPVRIFFQGQDDNPKYFDGKLSPFLFLLPFFAFFQMSANAVALRTEKKFLMLYALLFVLYAFCTTSIRIRYIAPIIPPLIILSVFGFHNIACAFAKRWRNLPQWLTRSGILLLGGAILAYNGLYIVQQFNYVQPFSYLSGEVSRDAYIEKYRPEYPIYQYANRNLHDRAKILGLFLGNRRYYCDRKLIFGQKAFQESIQRSKSLEELIKDLQMDGYTHFMIRFDLFNQWVNKQFDQRQKQMLQALFTTHLRAVSSKNGYGLFELI